VSPTRAAALGLGAACHESATMLREDLVPNSYSFNSQQLADHYTPGGGRGGNGHAPARPDPVTSGSAQ